MSYKPSRPSEQSALLRQLLPLGSLALALLASVILFYGSLAPFDYHNRRWSEIGDRFAPLNVLTFYAGMVPFQDLLINTSLGILLGFFWVGVVLMDRPGWPRPQTLWQWGWQTAAAIPVALLLGLPQTVAAEFLQHWFGHRVPALADILTQAVGIIIGTGLWTALGQKVVDVVCSSNRRLQVEWMLQAYCVFLFVCLTFPFNMVFNPLELYRRYSPGQTTLLPFGALGATYADAIIQLVVNLVACFPLGLAVALVGVSGGRATRSLPECVVLSAVMVYLYESAQLWTSSRAADVTDILIGTIGAVCGAKVAIVWWSASPSQPNGRLSPRDIWMWPVICLVYALLVAVLFWWPLEWARDERAVRLSLNQFLRLPLASWLGRSPAEVMRAAMRNFYLMLPLGVGLGIWAYRLNQAALLHQARTNRHVVLSSDDEISPTGRTAVIAGGLLILGAVFVLAVELGQAFFRRYPDATEVIIGIGGLASGLLGVLLILSSADEHISLQNSNSEPTRQQPPYY